MTLAPTNRGVALPRPLSIAEIEDLAAEFRQSLTDECERLLERGDNSGALSALRAKRYVDQFVDKLKLRAGSRLGVMIADKFGYDLPARRRKTGA